MIWDLEDRIGVNSNIVIEIYVLSPLINVSNLNKLRIQYSNNSADILILLIEKDALVISFGRIWLVFYKNQSYKTVL